MNTTRMLALCLSITAACSSSSTNDKDSGPVWPDGLTADRNVPDAATDDVAAPTDQAPAPDRIAIDLGPPLDGPSSGWGVVLKPSIIGVDLHAVACVSDHVFIVGDQGAILHRKPDGELETQALADGAATDLYTVAFADESYGVVAGNGSQIWKTEDLGQSWPIAPQCSAFQFEAFYGMHLHSATEGFGAGVAVNGAGAGTKYFAGASWVCIEPTYPDKIFYDVFRRGDNGWVVGDTGGEIYTTTVKGQVWEPQPAGTDAVLRGVAFAGDAIGVAVGEGGTIVRSVDGQGEIWSTVSSGVSEDLWGVHFVDDKLGWAVGDAGTILHSDDGGESWTPQSSPVTTRLEDVCFTSTSEGWIVGAGGALLRTDTGGQ